MRFSIRNNNLHNICARNSGHNNLRYKSIITHGLDITVLLPLNAIQSSNLTPFEPIISISKVQHPNPQISHNSSISPYIQFRISKSLPFTFLTGTITLIVTTLDTSTLSKDLEQYMFHYLSFSYLRRE